MDESYQFLTPVTPITEVEYFAELLYRNPCIAYRVLIRMYPPSHSGVLNPATLELKVTPSIPVSGSANIVDTDHEAEFRQREKATLGAIIISPSVKTNPHLWIY